MNRKIEHLREGKDGSYCYIRDYPPKAIKASPKYPKQFCRHLGLDNSCSDADLYKAMEESNRLFEIRVKMIRASNPEVSAHSEECSAFQEIFANAWAVSQEDMKFGPRKTMREAWNDYLKANNINISTADGKQKQARFEEILSLTGNFIISDDTKDEILSRIQTFISDRLLTNPEIKAELVKRELADFVASISSVPKLSWGDSLTLDHKMGVFNFKLPEKPFRGRSFRDEELYQLINLCLNKPDEKCTCLLVMAHAGMSIGEIKRLNPDSDLYLSSEYPHIIFRGNTDQSAKSRYRPRVVPIVIGLDVVGDWLPSTIEWLNSSERYSPQKILSKQLRNLFGNEPTIKTSCFRHTWLRLAKRAQISEDSKGIITGWKKNDHDAVIMDIFCDPKTHREAAKLLRQLYQDQLIIFSRFISGLSPDVVFSAFPRRTITEIPTHGRSTRK